MKTVLRLEIPHFDARKTAESTGKDSRGRNCRAPAKPTKTAKGTIACRKGSPGGKAKAVKKTGRTAQLKKRVASAKRKASRRLETLGEQEARAYDRFVASKKGQKLIDQGKDQGEVRAAFYSVPRNKARAEESKELRAKLKQLEGTEVGKSAAIARDRSADKIRRELGVLEQEKRGAKKEVGKRKSEKLAKEKKEKQDLEKMREAFAGREDELPAWARKMLKGDSLSARIDSMISDLHDLAA